MADSIQALRFGRGLTILFFGGLTDFNKLEQALRINRIQMMLFVP